MSKKSDPFKGVSFRVPAGEEQLRHVHRAYAAIPDAFHAFKRSNAYQFFHDHATKAAAWCDLTLFKTGIVDTCEFPLAAVEQVARKLDEADQSLYLSESPESYPVLFELPPSLAVLSNLKAKYMSLPLRHVRGECEAKWIMKDGKYVAHKGRKVSGAQVGPFIVHAEPVVNYAVTHERSGHRLGALPFKDMAEAKVFALLSGWLYPWDCDGNFPEAEVEFVTSLIKAWKANRWDHIAKLCTLDSEPLVNDPQEEVETEVVPVPVDRVLPDEEPTIDPVALSEDAMRVSGHLTAGKSDFKTLSALLDFDVKRTVSALRLLRDRGIIRHVEQAANAPTAQNFGPGDSFEILPE